MRSSITEHSFHGIEVLPMCPVQSVIHVSGRSIVQGKRRGSLKASHNCSDGTLSLNGASSRVFGSRST